MTNGETERKFWYLSVLLCPGRTAIMLAEHKRILKLWAHCTLKKEQSKGILGKKQAGKKNKEHIAKKQRAGAGGVERKASKFPVGSHKLFKQVVLHIG